MTEQTANVKQYSKLALRAEIRAVLVLTAAYVPATSFDCSKHGTVVVGINYSKGDETSMEVKFETSPDNANWREIPEIAAASGGFRALTVPPLQAVADFDGDVSISVATASFMRVSVKATGGGPTGTVAIDWYGGAGV